VINDQSFEPVLGEPHTDEGNAAPTPKIKLALQAKRLEKLRGDLKTIQKQAKLAESHAQRAEREAAEMREQAELARVAARAQDEEIQELLRRLAESELLAQQQAQRVERAERDAALAELRARADAAEAVRRGKAEKVFQKAAATRYPGAAGKRLRPKERHRLRQEYLKVGGQNAMRIIL
jgi:hypothetical protein